VLQAAHEVEEALRFLGFPPAARATAAAALRHGQKGGFGRALGAPEDAAHFERFRLRASTDMSVAPATAWGVGIFDD
jgi:hypothetical protein